MQSNAQLALPLYETAEAEALAYHNPARFGWFSVLTQPKPDSRAKVQRSHPLHLMPEVLQDLDPTKNAWLSQSEFNRPNRRLINLERMGVLFVDLDTYNVPSLRYASPEGLAELLLKACERLRLPPPSLIVWSGRGLQVKWILLDPVPAQALPRWQAVQNKLCDKLAELGADQAARDASRVLRLIATTNTKSGERVRVLFKNTIAAGGAVLSPSGLAVYSFETMAFEVLDITRVQLDEMRAARAAEWAVERAARAARKSQFVVVGSTNGLKKLIPAILAWDRLGDMRKLMKLRGYAAGMPDGQRNTAVWLSASFLASAVVVPKFYAEVFALAREFAPHWTKDQISGSISTVYAKAKDAAAGKKVKLLNGVEYDPRYRVRNSTIIDLMEIIPDEERQLKTIISVDEARRRDAERDTKRRREAGAVDRATYLAGHEQKRDAGRLLRAQGRTWAEVATELGYANGEAARRSIG